MSHKRLEEIKAYLIDDIEYLIREAKRLEMLEAARSKRIEELENENENLRAALQPHQAKPSEAEEESD